MPNGPPTRYEWDALNHRIDQMDARGTSGAAGFQVRLEAAERELAALRQQQADQKRERSSTRRWMIGAAFTAAAVVTAVASFLLTYVFHVR